MNELQKIESRIAEITAEVEKRSKELTKEDLETLNKEMDGLIEARKKIIAEEEERQALLDKIANGSATGTTITKRNFTPKADEDGSPFGTVEYRNAFKKYVSKGIKIPDELRANQVTNTDDAGAVIPTTIVDTVIEKLESTGMILPLVTKTSYKGSVSIPYSSVKPVATWVAEGSGSDTQKKSITGTINFIHHKLRCAVAVSFEVDTMSLSSFENLIIKNIVEAMTKSLEISIIRGTGNGQPKGILLPANVTSDNTVVLAANAFTYSDLVKVEGKLPVEYENNAVWVMTKKTWASLEGMQDANGRPILQSVVNPNGKFERIILGRPVVICNYLASLDENTASDTVVAFLFNFKDYVLNANYQLTLSSYRDNETDDFVRKAIMLVDGQVVDTGSLIVVKTGA